MLPIIYEALSAEAFVEDHNLLSPSTASRASLDLPGAIPHPVELVDVGHIPQQVVVYVAGVRMDAAPDAAIAPHAGSKAVPLGCAQTGRAGEQRMVG